MIPPCECDEFVHRFIPLTWRWLNSCIIRHLTLSMIPPNRMMKLMWTYFPLQCCKLVASGLEIIFQNDISNYVIPSDITPTRHHKDKTESKQPLLKSCTTSGSFKLTMGSQIQAYWNNEIDRTTMQMITLPVDAKM